MRPASQYLLASLLLIASSPLSATEITTGLEQCAGVPDDDKRLRCFDQLAANSRTPGNTANTEEPSSSGRLSKHWELARGDKDGILSIQPHHKNYALFANYSSSPNQKPFEPFKAISPADQDPRLKDTEIKYQISLKTKLLEDITPLHADIWAAYTQQSHWQAYNKQASSPFRDTNYQPEIMAIIPANLPLFGMKLKFVGLGVVHQSNGQTLTLSRSWDRIYAQAGLERGDFNVVARIWKRRPEDIRTDDNPDIVDYMGNGDIVTSYHHGGHEFSLTSRYNFRTHKGAVLGDWSFPLAPRLKGYVQVFSGYGQSLIDYNHRQTTLGLGVLLDY